MSTTESGLPISITALASLRATVGEAKHAAEAAFEAAQEGLEQIAAAAEVLDALIEQARQA